ncbi:Uncharacterised protein [Mycobacteroides abscessus subsp. abscessus]|nr:Uncharacterised protein [Mycobacteroides abscessus subsp. abscessus]
MRKLFQTLLNTFKLCRGFALFTSRKADKIFWKNDQLCTINFTLLNQCFNDFEVFFNIVLRVHLSNRK